MGQIDKVIAVSGSKRFCQNQVPTIIVEHTHGRVESKQIDDKDHCDSQDHSYYGQDVSTGVDFIIRNQAFPVIFDD